MKKVVIFEFFTGNIAGAQKVTLNIIPMLKKKYDVVIFQRLNNTLYSDTVKEFGDTKKSHVNRCLLRCLVLVDLRELKKR